MYEMSLTPLGMGGPVTCHSSKAAAYANKSIQIAIEKLGSSCYPSGSGKECRNMFQDLCGMLRGKMVV